VRQLPLAQLTQLQLARRERDTWISAMRRTPSPDVPT
jgi:hypothetical protein